MYDDCKNPISCRLAMNALYIANWNPDLRVGEMEVAAGFKRAGYLARYAKDEFGRGIPIDSAMKIAKYLGYDLVDLCTKDYGNYGVEYQKQRKKPVDRLMEELGFPSGR